MFGKKQIDQKREAFVKEIKSFFEKLGERLTKTSKNDSKEVLEMITQIGGNVLLIQNFNFQLLQNSPFDDIKEVFSSYFESQNIENEFQRRKIEKQELLEELLFTLEDIMDIFAESMDSSDSSNDSDSSSDSSGSDSGGDSGCSGCGGGCGGGD
jgi:5-methylcytosine-specific restriction endonuclease McrBC regulatory subunit McrC